MIQHCHLSRPFAGPGEEAQTLPAGGGPHTGAFAARPLAEPSSADQWGGSRFRDWHRVHSLWRSDVMANRMRRSWPALGVLALVSYIVALHPSPAQAQTSVGPRQSSPIALT